MASSRICSMPDCGKPHRAKGYCSSHYALYRLHGTPEGKGTKAGEPLRWIDHALLYEMDECLIWPFARTPAGYAVVTYDGMQTTAHRVLCLWAHGPAPSDLHEVAHSCGNGHLGCLNPKHVRWATHVENCADRKLHKTDRNMPRKLMALDYETIREIAPHMPVREIASFYGIHNVHAYNIISGRRGKV